MCVCIDSGWLLGHIRTITCKLERIKLILPVLGFQELWDSKLKIQAVLERKDHTIVLAGVELVDLGTCFALNDAFPRFFRLILPGEDDRSPSSGADSGEDRRGEGVAILRVLIRPYSQYGVHARWLWFSNLSRTRHRSYWFIFNLSNIKCHVSQWLKRILLVDAPSCHEFNPCQRQFASFFQNFALFSIFFYFSLF